MSNEELDTQIRRHELQIERSRARLRRLSTGSQAAAQAEQYRLSMLRQDLETLQDRRESLTMRAPFDGQVIAPELERVEGRFLKLGEPVFVVASLGKLRVTTVVDDEDIAAVRGSEGESVRIKFRSHPGEVFEGHVERVHPSATHDAPPAGLTDKAGGPVLLDPEARSQARALLAWYRVDLVLEVTEARPPVGTTGTARFLVGREPVGVQLWLRFRRMLHRRFLI
jgi:multidrug efflux pump subunit AcrA (membrane-fusion protein)